MFLTLVGWFVLPSLAVQVPLGLPSDGNPSLDIGTASAIAQPYNFPNPLDSDGLDHSPWQLDKPPAADETGHFVFETVNSLLQHWPNTRYRNGQSYYDLGTDGCLTHIVIVVTYQVIQWSPV
jgi:hypothetical protein